VALAATQDYVSPGSDPAPGERAAARATTLVEGPAGLIGQQVGQYRVQRELGRGGMGVVYEALHAEIGQRAALKTLHPEISSNPQFKRRFLNETTLRRKSGAAFPAAGGLTSGAGNGSGRAGAAK
jgi:serine/threonine protein kinase